MATVDRITPFDHETVPVRVVFGPGRLAEAGDEADRLGLRRVMVIADEGVPGAGALAGTLGDRLVVRWDEVVQHVPVDLAERARKAALAEDVDGLVTLGGGSATGLAKAIALETGLPILAVPTTYAGSELTPVFGMTCGQRKRTGSDERVRPRTVLYDPELTVDLPASVTGPSAFNAMAHCFAALWSPRRDPLTSALAVEAIRTVVASLPVLADTPTDLDARAGLQYAAFLAGTALGRCGPGLQHRICHVLGGRLDLSHADTHSVVLPHVVALNAASRPDLVERLVPVLGDRPGTGLWDLARRCGLATGLARLGARREALHEVAEDVAGTPNPVPATVEVVETLLVRALDDEAPAED
jgi:maleylacetate reductase